jgi:hypothetical protein
LWVDLRDAGDGEQLNVEAAPLSERQPS